MSVDREGAPGYPTAAPWAQWIDAHVRCPAIGRHGRCQLVRGHDQPHAVVLLVAAGKQAWRWPRSAAGPETAGDLACADDAGVGSVGWLDDGGPWGNVATDRAPWIPGWP